MSELQTPVVLLVTLTGATVIVGAAVSTYGAILLFRRLCSTYGGGSSIHRRALDTLPVTAYADGSRSSVHSRVPEALPVTAYAGGSRASPESCAICLGDYEEGEAVRVLPRCKHCLHRDCLDQWLMRSSICPICRTTVTELKIVTTSAGGDSDQIVSNFVYDCPPMTSVVVGSDV